MAKVKVLVADERSLFLESVCVLLNDCESIDLVGKATNGKEIVEKVREQAPNVVLMDMTMPIMDGTEVIRQIHGENSDVKVLLVSQHEDRQHILRGLKAGSNGYIPRSATLSELVSAILTLHTEGCFLYPSVAKTLVEEYRRMAQTASHDPYDRLIDREREVLKLIAEGHTSLEIAETLDIAVKTVLGHRASIMTKLSIHNWTELIKYAIRKHLINLES